MREGEKNYNVKNLSRLLSIYHMEETYHGLYGRLKIG